VTAARVDTPVLSLGDVIKVYKEGPIETVALRGVHLDIAPGEYVAICGPSGCGKSTLLAIAGGLTRPTAGRVQIGGREISGLSESELSEVRRATLGMVFQSDNLFSWMSAQENVELAVRLAGGSDARRLSHELLASVGLESRARERVSKLSGGERQRVSIAVAIANQPRVLLADEITGELDSKSAGSVLDTIDRLVAEQGTAVIAVTHNPEAAARAMRQVDMVDGKIETGPPDER